MPHGTRPARPIRIPDGWRESRRSDEGETRALNLDVYAESFYPRRLGWAPLRTLRDARFKLIDAPRPELYDLARDPFEERNIVDEYPKVAAALPVARQGARTGVGEMWEIDIIVGWSPFSTCSFA
jgi:arylsulfatase A-like enzyme